MSLFDRKPTPQGERTPEERERARAERAARRAGLEGVPTEAVVPPPLEVPPDASPAPPAAPAPVPASPEPVAAPAQPEPAPEPAPEPVAPEPPARKPAAPAPAPAPVVPPAPTVAHPAAPARGPASAPAPVARAAPAAPQRAPEAPAPGTPAPNGPVPRPATPNGPVEAPAMRRVPRERPPAPAGPPAPSEPVPAGDPPSVVFDAEPVHDWTSLDEATAPRRRLPRPPRRPAPPGGRDTAEGPRWGARIVALAALALVAVGIWVLFSVFQPLHGDGEGRTSVVIPRGASIGQAADALAERGVIGSRFFFGLRTRFSDKRSDIKPGGYSLPRDMRYTAALDALVKGPPKPKTTPITITEGRTRREASALLAKTSLRGNYAAATIRSPLLDRRRYGAPRGTPHLEGFLFPATYEVRVGAPITDLVNKQLQTFKRRFAAVDLSAARRAKLSAYDVLIIASMVEREAQLDRERPVIASVIYNRLRQGIPLGIDATIRYATGNYETPLKESELAIDSPYNTRLNQGLPPTPIGNPGIESIRAAAKPARTRFLYFVVKPGRCGEHAFSITDAQFQRDVERYNSAREAQGGRSPVKC